MLHGSRVAEGIGSGVTTLASLYKYMVVDREGRAPARGSVSRVESVCSVVSSLSTLPKVSGSGEVAGSRTVRC